VGSAHLRYGRLLGRRDLLSWARITAATALMGAIVAWLAMYWPMPEISGPRALALLGFYVVAGAGTYFLAFKLLRAPEADVLARVLRRRSG
jgi:hypothetical protein